MNNITMLAVIPVRLLGLTCVISIRAETSVPAGITKIDSQCRYETLILFLTILKFEIKSTTMYETIFMLTIPDITARSLSLEIMLTSKCCIISITSVSIIIRTVYTETDAISLVFIEE
ncbi:hypothetical protein SDC9_86242 [bioreactor metagenome]|uniref:Uncharacterized protein n=1 Tax=bioreactor metagenome TaxID=1076179 RepID=A0A644ZH20_9ZZZZ